MRVGMMHSKLQSEADKLLQLVEQSNTSARTTNRQNTGEDSSDAGTPASKTGPTELSESSPEKFSSPASEKSSESTGLAGWMSLIGGFLSWSTVWWGTGSGLFGIMMFIVGMSFGGSNRNSSSRGNSLGKNWEDHPANQGGRLSDDDREEVPDPDLDKEIKTLVEERVEKRVQEIDDQLQEIRENVLKLYQKQIEPLQRRVVELEEKLKEKQGPEETQADSAPAQELGASEKVGNAFVKWCREGGSRVRRIGRFRSFLKEEIPVEEVREIQYEKDSASDEFLDDARNGITFWLVRMGGAQYVLPKPLNNSQFDKLEPVFEGRSGPDTLESIQPAELTRQAGRLVLAASGRVW